MYWSSTITPSVKPIIFPVVFYFSFRSTHTHSFFAQLIFQLKSEYNTFRHHLTCLSISFYDKTIFYFTWDAFLAVINAEYIFHIWTTPCFCFFFCVCTIQMGSNFFLPLYIFLIFARGVEKLLFLIENFLQLMEHSCIYILITQITLLCRLNWVEK